MLQSSQWPSQRTIHASLNRKTHLRFETESGVRVAGVKSDKPWILLADLNNEPALLCERCKTASELPDPPAGGGEAHGPRSPLFDKTDKRYALFVLSQAMYPFYHQHSSCVKKESN